ncbi:MAG: hypothetical protein KF764_29240 [Labilithrix sp.]|nr:hypothetical protein [Labilithrix sp.]MBX3223415.1 hypothetical protein [Labilithrix sp.]
MRRYIPALLLTLAAIAPFPLAGCDILNKLKGGGDDAGAEAAAEAPDAEAAPAETDTAPVPAPTTTLTTVTPTATSTAVRPAATDAGAVDAAIVDSGGATVVVDAGAPVVVDAGAAKTDAGPAPAPTPTLKIPQNLFDGGLRFDAGGFKPPWQH